MPDKIYDVVVIGSGPAGAHSAYPLVKAGLKVAMLDGGVQEESSLEDNYEGDFEYIRKTNKDQSKLFLGKDLSGILSSDENTHSRMRMCGPKSYLSEKTDLLPIKSKDIQLLQTLAKGGLSEVWGGVCDFLDDEELERIGIPKEEMTKSYQEVIDLIGISGESERFKLQPPSKIDFIARKILLKCSNNKNSIFNLKKPSLALLTSQLGNRKPTDYSDLDFWLNRGGSIYRTRFTIEQLEKSENFNYLPNSLVRKVTLKGKLNYVESLSLDKKQESFFRSKYVVLAAGSLNTLKILLRSFDLYNIGVPFMIKAHILIPCIHFPSVGRKNDRKKHSLCQLVIENQSKIDGLGSSYSQIYTYKSLLLFKLLQSSPISIPESLSLLSILSSSLAIVDVRFPTFLNEKTRVVLRKSEIGDFIEVSSKTSEDIEHYRREISKIKKFIFKLGLIPIGEVKTPPGSTAHYAGGISEGLPLSVDKSGRLNKNNSIFIADSSTWQALPAKPPALTIMANANRIGKNLLKIITNRR